MNFRQQKSLKNQYLPHSVSKSYQINPAHQGLSNNTKGTYIPILPKFSTTIWVKKSFNIQELLHHRPNTMKPSRCTPPPPELSKDTKNRIWSIPVEWISSSCWCTPPPRELSKDTRRTGFEASFLPASVKWSNYGEPNRHVLTFLHPILLCRLTYWDHSWRCSNTVQ